MGNAKLEFIVDTETFPQVFILCAEAIDSDLTLRFEISPYRNDSAVMYAWLLWMSTNGGRLTGFNFLAFDGPLVQVIMRLGGKVTAAMLYEKAMAIINSQDGDRFAHMVYPSDRSHEWLCLLKVWHFDNKSRMTSLKTLEFNLRMTDVRDLPFQVGSILNEVQTKTLGDYCQHDVKATKIFRKKSDDKVKFREELTSKYGRDFLNHSDVKIGSEIFQMELEKAGVECYTYGTNGRQPKQTPRPVIALKDAILPWVKFENVEFQRIHQWMLSQVITETKGVFEDVTATVGGLEFTFGTGGLHAAVENMTVEAGPDLVIESRDVSSYYPNLAITQKFYPEHLGLKFCEIYKQLYEQRKTHAKGSSENAALKLALNGSFGKANDRFSIFYDPLFLLKITLNGQMLLCMLIEQLIKIPTLKMLMCNTDGLEYAVHPDHVVHANMICDWWMQATGLTLEGARYKRLVIKDCNNYLGVFDE